MATPEQLPPLQDIISTMHASTKKRSLREAQGVLAAFDAQVEEAIATDRDAVERALAEPFERVQRALDRTESLRREAEASREKAIKAGNEVKLIQKGIADLEAMLAEAQRLYDGSTSGAGTAALAARLQQVLDANEKRVAGALEKECERAKQTIAGLLESVAKASR